MLIREGDQRTVEIDIRLASRLAGVAGAINAAGSRCPFRFPHKKRRPASFSGRRSAAISGTTGRVFGVWIRAARCFAPERHAGEVARHAGIAQGLNTRNIAHVATRSLRRDKQRLTYGLPDWHWSNHPAVVTPNWLVRSTQVGPHPVQRRTARSSVRALKTGRRTSPRSAWRKFQMKNAHPTIQSMADNSNVG
jgi:hypothetical protein